MNNMNNSNKKYEGLNSWYKFSKSTEHHYSWVFINLPKDICKKMDIFSQQIDEEDLFTGEGNNGREDNFHITVKYGLLTEDAKDPRECIKGLKGGKAYLGSSSIFETEKYDVVKITVESDALENIHNELNKLPHEDKYMEYQAHATIAYVKKGCGKKYNKKFKLNKNFSFNKVFFGNNEKDYKIALSKVVFNFHKYASQIKLAKSIRLYRGKSQYNKGGKYWTPNKEWAMQFTQSGLPSQVESRTFPVERIFINNPLPSAINAEELDATEELAVENGYSAFWVNEGMDQPESVYII